MAGPNSTPFVRRSLYRRHAKLAIAIYRDGATLPQLIAIARIRVRMAARGARHVLGGWTPAPGPTDAAIVTCARCGAQARLELATGLEDVRGVLEACK